VYEICERMITREGVRSDFYKNFPFSVLIKNSLFVYYMLFLTYLLRVFSSLKLVRDEF
jgi:hypothetical protein